MQDEEKDLFIRQKLEKDNLVSKKYDDVFDNFLKGDHEMKKELRIESKEEKQKVPKNKWIRGVAAVAACALIFTGANVYATTQGYDNIFFLIKDLGNKDKQVTATKDEILSDSDTTISYTNIKLADGLFIQINRFVVKNGKAKLLLLINEDGSKVKPYKFTVISDGMYLAEQTNNHISDPSNIGQYQVEVNLNSNYKEEMKVLTLRIEEKNTNILATLTIDLGNREISVNEKDSQEEIQKISEVDLKEKLGQYAIMLKPYQDYSREEAKFLLTSGLLWEKVSTERIYGFPRTLVNEALKEATGEEELTKEMKSSLVKYNKERDSYEVILAGDYDTKGLCLNIDDLKYENEKYIVTFTYCAPTEADFVQGTIETLPRYQATLEFVLNENAKYTKYQVLNFDTAVSEKIKEESKLEEKPQVPEHTHNYSIITAETTGNYHTTLDGKHTLRCSVCGETKQEPHRFDKWWALETNGNPFWTLWCQDCNQYVYTEDYSVVQNSGYAVQETNNSCEQEILGDWYAISAVDGNGNEVSLTSIYGSGVGISNGLTFKENGVAVYGIGIQGEYTSGTYTTWQQEIYLTQGEQHYLIYNEETDNITEIYYSSYEDKTYYITIVRGTFTPSESALSPYLTEEVDNYASSMTWVEGISTGLRFQYPSEWNFETISYDFTGNDQGELSTRISGIAKGIDKSTNERIDSNIEIDFYKPEWLASGVSKEDYIYSQLGIEVGNVYDLTGYGTNSDSKTRWFLVSKEDYESNIRYEYYYNFTETSGDLILAYRIDLINYNLSQKNWKVTNITNWLFGTIELRSF